MKLFQLLIVPLASARVVRQQIPIVDHAEKGGTVDPHPVADTHTDQIAPAIGVHFTSSFAVAAARYQNGTTRDLVKVAGGSEYIDLMSRWTSRDNDVPEKCHAYEGYSTVSEVMRRRYKCSLRFLQHSTRRMLGLPRSRDAGIFSNFLKEVRGAIEAEMGTPITAVTPAFPSIDQDLEEDIRESFTIAGLNSTQNNIDLFSLTGGYDEANAAYATLDQRRAKSLFVHGDCINGTRELRREHILYLNFDNSSFSVGATSFCNPFKVQLSEWFKINSELGWWNLPVFDVPRAEFWEQMQEMIMDVIQPMTIPPSRFILLGEHGADDEFKEVVKNAVWEKFEFDAGMMLAGVKKEDVGYRAARGAAELAWLDRETHIKVAALQH